MKGFILNWICSHLKKDSKICSLFKFNQHQALKKFIVVHKCNDEVFTKFVQNFRFYPSFISWKQHHNLLEEIDNRTLLTKKTYQTSHFDQVIFDYREIEFPLSSWSSHNSATIRQVMSLFPSDTRWLQTVHILDLSENGFIGPHIDSVKFSGPIIATLSLLSTRVMRLKHDLTGSLIDVLVEPRSLYVMKDFVRFEWTHEILGNEQTFNEKKFKCNRRISIIFRDEVDTNNPYFKQAFDSSHSANTSTLYSSQNYK